MMHPWPVPDSGRLAAIPVAIALAACIAAACSAAPVEPDVSATSIAVPWSADPIVIDEAVAALAERPCREMEIGIPQRPVTEPVAVADARGGSKVFMVFAIDAFEAECFAELGPSGEWMRGVAGSTSVESGGPAPRALTIVGGTKIGEGPGAVSSVVGRVGPGVSSVVIATGRGQRIRASLGPTGWYAAWWPSDDPYVVVTAYDAAGSATGMAQ
jgi:hypothetical protein